MHQKPITIRDQDLQFLSISPKTVEGLVRGFKKNKKFDTYLQDKAISRIAYTASRIPVAKNDEEILVDIGIKMFWLPIYVELLGYKHIIMLRRSRDAFSEYSEYVDSSEIGKDFRFGCLESDTEFGKYPIEDMQVSCVVCSAILEHLAGDPMHLFVESNRILKPNGILCVTTPNVLYYRNLINFMFGGHPFGWSSFTPEYADRHNREYTPWEVQRLFEAAGFDVQLLETIALKSKDRRDLEWLLGYLLCLPAAIGRKVHFSMRNLEIVIRGKKVDHVRDRFPTFLYRMDDSKKVRFPSRLEKSRAS